MGRRLAPALGACGAVALVAARLHYALRPEDVPNPYAITHLTIAVTSLPVGVWLAHRRRDLPIGWVILAAGLLGAWMYAAQPLIVELVLAGAGERVIRPITWLVTWPWLLARSLLLIVAPSLVVPELLRRARSVVMWVAVGATVVLCAAQLALSYNQPLDDRDTIAPSAIQPLAEDVARWATRLQWGTGVAAVVLLASAGSLLGGSAVRRQTRWFVLGSALFGLVALSQIGREVRPEWSWPGDRWELAASAVLPVSLAAAVLVDRLIDVAWVVRRVVLYVTLAAIGLAVYGTTAAIAADAFGASSRVERALGAVAVVLALAPAHAWLQRWIDRRVYGAASRPAQVLGEVGHHIAAAPDAERALQTLTAAIGTAMRLPAVSIVRDTDASASAEREVFTIVSAGERLGTLLATRRSSGEPLRPTDRELLAGVAAQAGVLLRDIELERQLRSSRQDLVVAREEERRRLRADLHDGLGPTLASVAMGLDAAAQRLDDRHLSGLLMELHHDVRAAIDDIRRVAHGLRPPALDELGLAGAVEQHSRSVATRAGGDLRVTVTSGALPALPAAVEVAAYRIALEAITNVTRHARASRCDVTLDLLADDLVVEVVDDGIGFDASASGGVGLRSMRDRAEELWGSFRVEPASPGTRIRAQLPIGWVA